MSLNYSVTKKPSDLVSKSEYIGIVEDMVKIKFDEALKINRKGMTDKEARKIAHGVVITYKSKTKKKAGYRIKKNNIYLYKKEK